MKLIPCDGLTLVDLDLMMVVVAVMEVVADEGEGAAFIFLLC